MNILWFSWKDSHHTKAGGAEAVSSRLREQLVRDGHQVTLITAHYPGSLEQQTINGVDILRTGNAVTVYPKAAWLFRRRLAKWPDLIIDEMNTIPFGCALYSRRRAVLLTYQLARRVWFYQAPFPVSIIGFGLEPAYLWLLSHLYKTVLTESESTRTDLRRFGFGKNQVSVFRVGIELEPVSKLTAKKDQQTVLVLGAIRPMKQTLDAIKAFELARDTNPAIKLVVAGDNTGAYAQKVIKHVHKSRHAAAINVMGRVSKETKLKLMKESAVIVVTSVKEGWGLIVTEANSQGTPAVAYDNDGLRDSIQNNKTGLLTEPGNLGALAQAINQLLSDPDKLETMRQAAHKFSQQFTYQNSYDDFTKALKINKHRI